MPRTMSLSATVIGPNRPLKPGVLDELLKKISKAQLLSIVDSRQRRIALWPGSVSAGKTFASLIAFLLAVKGCADQRSDRHRRQQHRHDLHERVRAAAER